MRNRRLRELRSGGAVAEADVDLSVPKAEANPDATGVEIETFEVDAGLRYRAVLVPQQTSLTVEVILEDGTTCSKSISEALFGGGKSYDLSIVVSAGEPPVIEVSLSGEIADWEDGGSLEDSENSDDGGEEPTQGVDYEGEHYGTATIGGAEWMTENLRYKPVGAQIGTGFWYPYDNDAAAVPTKRVSLRLERGCERRHGCNDSRPRNLSARMAYSRRD